MHHGNRLRRQLGGGIELLDRRIVPGLDLAEENFCERGSVELEVARLDALRFTTGISPPMTVGNWIRPAFLSSSGFSGMSEAPKVTVLAWICLMPPPDPID
jgi:hypothetical protein